MLYDEIKKLCKAQGISIQKLEKEAKLPNGTVSKWNKSAPNVFSFFLVCKILGVQMESLINKCIT